ncbi:hypothetical protein [Novosphingopyxis sp.]|uniref:hypothetical protein n=1 Tax=Novosphingopyxis sp. TaxID=2709690 RepID=UPI003B5C0FF7
METASDRVWDGLAGNGRHPATARGMPENRSRRSAAASDAELLARLMSLKA